MSDRFQRAGGHRVDVTPSERVAIVTRELMRGRALTKHDVAKLTECEPDSGYRVLSRLARVLPLHEEDGRWSLVDSLNLQIE